MSTTDSKPGRAFEMTRRTLLKALGGGLLIMAAGPDTIAMALAQRPGLENIPQEISAWIHIGQSGVVTAYTGKVEVGQNARTNVTQAVAEELRVPISTVTVIMGDTDLVPWDMGTFGSRTTPTMIPQVRRAAAGARELLLQIASKKWGIPQESLTAESGEVRDGAGSRRATYGELAAGQSFDEKIDVGIALTPAGDWKVMGKSVQKVDGRDFVTGNHRYTYDMAAPGMLYGMVLRPPALRATLASVDTSAAEAISGVKVVHEGDFVAVAAPKARTARAALAAIKATWSPVPQPSSKDLWRILRGEHQPQTQIGRAAVYSPFAGTYRCAYIAHVPLEPRAALAEWDGKKMKMHTGTQRPFAVRDEVAQALGLTNSQVRVIVPDTGSGYGGKHTGEAAVEAARIAKALGVPIKVRWTRPEEFTFAYFRPAGVVEIQADVDPEGRLALWQHQNYNSGNPGIATPYEVANPAHEFFEADAPLRQGSYRALAATFNNFARETAMDELAHAHNIDPVEFRIKNLRDGRLKAVLKSAAEKFGWPGKSANGLGAGIACGTEKGSYIATAAEVTVDEDSGTVRINRAVTAFECGAIVNPDLLKNQVVGALIMGIGGALFEEIDFDNGKVLTDTLRSYRVPRYSDVPEIECVLLDRKDLPSDGAGETPIICIAPAVGNAIFRACGQRLRAMPLKLG